MASLHVLTFTIATMSSALPSLPLPFSPRRVLVGGQGHATIASAIRVRRPDLEITSKDSADITADDLNGAEVFVGFRPPRPEYVSNMGAVKWVHSTGAGIDPWLNEPSLSKSVLLTRSSESFGPIIAEWVVGRVFAIQQQIPSLMQAQHDRRWAPRKIAHVAGTRALLVGTGDIGRGIATALKALGCDIKGVSRSGQSTHSAFSSVHKVSELPELVGSVDWIISSVPDTPTTRGLLSREVFSRCRGAVLLNAGRGAVVEEAAIPEALDKGWLRAAALDVFQVEPLPESSPLWGDPRVIISPHISGLTTTEGVVNGFVECLEQLEKGAIPRWAIDRDRGY